MIAMPHSKGFAPVIILLVVAAALAFGLASYLLLKKPAAVPQQVFCTMEAKQCPDGSYVGRSGPKCEFAQCPSPTPTPAPTPAPSPDKACGGPNDGSCPLGYQCIQDCGPPVVRVDEPPPGYHCVTNEIAKRPRMCPICLASNTVIATPDGPVNVKDMRKGMRVWSIDAAGQKISSVVSVVSHTLVPKTHQVVHLVLSDGREVWVSPGHPTTSGQPVGELHAGSSYDGAHVQSANLVLYWDDATYDLLPSGPTGDYWANGILLGSTLKR